MGGLRCCVTVLAVLAIAAAAAPEEPGAAEGSLFDPAASAELLELVDPPDRDALSSALEDAGRNWSELAQAVRTLEGEERAAAVWLLDGAPHLDRLEMTAETLIEHVRYAFRARDEMPYAIPEDKFRPYILTYRIEEEPVEPWRRELFDLYGPVAEGEGEIVAAARAVNRDLAGRVSERDREFFGPRQSPLLTLRSGSGTEAEIAILACAAMKAIGIPSRQASVRALGAESGGASWIEILDGESWLPLYPLEPDAFGDFGHAERDHPDNVTVVATRSAFEQVLVTEEYTETGVIDVSFVADGKPAAEFEHFSISVLNRGALVPLDALEAVADEDGRFSATLGDGRYVVLAGARDASGNPFVTLREVDLEPGEARVVAFDVTPEGRVGLDPAVARSVGRVLEAVVLLDLRREPDVRMLPLIAGALSRRSENVAASYVSLGTPPEGLEEAVKALPRGASVVALGAEAMSYTSPGGAVVEVPDDPSEQPLVALFDLDTEAAVMIHRGYDLNIDRKLSDAIDARLQALSADVEAEEAPPGER
jgi:hypothetical protein